MTYLNTNNENSPTPISILLIDDHSLFRAGLAELLERRGINVIASVSNGEDGIVKAMTLKPDIILLDIRMPDTNGLQILKKLNLAGNKQPVIMVTTSRDEQDIAQALKNGAKGYLLKDMEPNELVNALHEIKKGETVVAPELAQTLAKALQGGSTPDSPQNKLGDLTPREFEILQYIAEGGSNKVIARALGITDGTVKLHVKAILRKLNVRSRVEAAVIAVENNVNRKELY